jgi:hypothetical protein
MCAEIKETVQAFNRVIEIVGDGKDPTVHYTLGIAHLMSENYSEAVK